MRVGPRRQQMRGARHKAVCPRCGAFYLRSAYIKIKSEGRGVWRKVGLFCEGCLGFVPIRRGKRR